MKFPTLHRALEYITEQSPGHILILTPFDVPPICAGMTERGTAWRVELASPELSKNNRWARVSSRYILIYRVFDDEWMVEYRKSSCHG